MSIGHVGIKNTHELFAYFYFKIPYSFISVSMLSLPGIIDGTWNKVWVLIQKSSILQKTWSGLTAFAGGTRASILSRATSLLVIHPCGPKCPHPQTRRWSRECGGSSRVFSPVTLLTSHMLKPACSSLYADLKCYPSASVFSQSCLVLHLMHPVCRISSTLPFAVVGLMCSLPGGVYTGLHCWTLGTRAGEV